MVVPYLPLELVEEIIDLLGEDTESLLSFSLVAVGWVHRSRRHLFATVKLNTLSDLQSWFANGLGACTKHVHSLGLTQDQEAKWITPGTLAGIQNNITSFYNVQSLTLTGLDLTLFDEHTLTRNFGHLSNRLTSLAVKGLTTHPDTLLFFICLFPKLDDISLDHLAMGKPTIPFQTPAITPKFRGKLSLSHIKAHGTFMLAPFVDPLIPMAFEEVSVSECRFETPQPLKDLFAACQTTMKKIHVSKIFLDDITQTPLIDLAPCKYLQEIRLSLVQLRQPSHWIEPILQTVTSNSIRKITFDTDFPTATANIYSTINPQSWSSLDALFLRMAHMLDSTDEKLELLFHALAPNLLGKSKPVDLGQFLEACREKAIVSLERAKT